MDYIPNYYNPLEEHNKMMEESIKRAQDMLKNQDFLFKEWEAPIDYMERIDKNLKNTIPALQEISESAKSQANSAEIIAKSAKEKANNLEKSMDSLNEISKSAEKIANQSNAHSWVAVFISLFALILEAILNWNELCVFVQSLFNH